MSHICDICEHRIDIVRNVQLKHICHIDITYMSALCKHICDIHVTYMPVLPGDHVCTAGLDTMSNHWSNDTHGTWSVHTKLNS